MFQIPIRVVITVSQNSIRLIIVVDTGHKFILILALLFSVIGCKGEPNISTKCLMNGLGRITCEYTNTGKGEGSVCGFVRVFKKDNDDKKINSDTFCSGPVRPKETKKLKTLFVDVREFCKSIYNDGKWGDECGFTFIESN